MDTKIKLRTIGTATQIWNDNLKRWMPCNKTSYDQLIKRDGVIIEGQKKEPLKYACFIDKEGKKMLHCNDGFGSAPISADKPIYELSEIMQKRSDGQKYVFNRLSYYEPVDEDEVQNL